MPLLRRLIGLALRRARLRQGLTLRDVAALARVSVAYLSEVERGRKEASSEVLAAICQGLGLRLGDLLDEVREELALVEPVLVPERGPRPRGTAVRPVARPAGRPERSGPQCSARPVSGRRPRHGVQPAGHRGLLPPHLAAHHDEVTGHDVEGREVAGREVVGAAAGQAGSGSTVPTWTAVSTTWSMNP